MIGKKVVKSRRASIKNSNVSIYRHISTLLTFSNVLSNLFKSLSERLSLDSGSLKEPEARKNLASSNASKCTLVLLIGREYTNTGLSVWARSFKVMGQMVLDGMGDVEEEESRDLC